MNKIKISFAYKLAASYMFFVLIAIIFMGYFSYITSLHSIEERTRINVTSTVQQMRDNIEYNTNVIKRMSSLIAYDNNISNSILLSENTKEAYESYTLYIQPIISKAILLSDKPVSAEMYQQNIFFPIISYGFDKNPLDKGQSYEIFNNDILKGQNWYDKLNLALIQTIWKQIDSDLIYGNISFIQNILDYQSTCQIGVIRIISSLEDIFHAASYKKIGQGACLFVVDCLGKPIYISSNSNIIPDNWEKSTKEFLIIEEPISQLNSKLVALVPLSEMRNDVKNMRFVNILFCILSFGILTILGIPISKILSKNVSRIVTSLNSFRDGDFQKRIQFNRSNDEFTDISIAFNEMAETIENLIQEIYVGKLDKKELELELLQAKVNPHFLYNTLNSISRLAKCNETDKMHEMIINLSKFYRLTLNDGKIIIPIGSEIEQVKAYVDIQSMKFSTRVNVSFSVDDSILNYKTISFIIQPFVENSIKHGLTKDKINIKIDAFPENNNIIFTIKDNGAGIPPELLSQILDSDAVSVGYGMRNVDQRIKLQFGEEYGVKILSTIGKGTSVIVTIPKYII